MTNELPAAVDRQGFCRLAWLLVATGGGWWKSREIAEALKMDGKDVNNRLHYMAKCRYLVSRGIPEERREVRARLGARHRVEFAVMPECMIPFGVTADQVSQALRGRPM